ncbi:aminopeptidase P family protein [Borreliella burgdorferi]|uniref:aminopeptidase P family protein n=1 Tax=Borreliella burgdorferi TaxID=139 RepID=UPI00016C3ED2|nr:aminopeptidase P family protein [Borreliella burgdorferi]ATH09645.1 aminopeptidase P family protein [Borreliella burgdorferi]EEE18986.1 putative peptidase [Borreliella burgdorferi 72a]EEF82439.1 putative peptidase [Borreliella burgdorferi WI91-23]MCD2418130.1 aminopeptidase P family protein [Borreliella burgdorferi]MCD2420314.1 aminopeptidase P family protein [Borreliella burgdorferi]
MDINKRLALLRDHMRDNGVDAYLVAGYDPHFSEYSHERYSTRKFITGFSGSFGTVIITLSKAVLFTDGRYFLQAEQELKGTEVALIKLGVKGSPDIFTYINLNLKESKLGIYSDEISIKFYKELSEKCKNTHIKALNQDLIDLIWKSRPQLEFSHVFELADAEKNNKRAEKIKSIYLILEKNLADFYVITALDEIAWVLNLRGADVEESALFYSFLLISRNKNRKNVLFVDIKKLDSGVKEALEMENFEIESYSNFYCFLDKIKHEGKFFVSFYANVRVLKVLGETNIILGESIISSLKALKTDYELLKMKEAHIIDAIALIKFLRKFKSLSKVELSELDEIDIADMLLHFRKLNKDFFSSSFDSIVGFRENGALPHYRPKRGKKINTNGLLLIDSGGSYFGLGTTDVTRVFLIGDASDEEKRDYTLVLKAFIGLSSLKFPYGSSGAFLDGICRLPLLKNELNFIHGTGHGVGFFLNVHELPVSISPNSSYLFKGSEVVSIEPGLYRTFSHGIRIENLVFVRQAFTNDFGAFLEFENLTLVPFEKELIVKEMLSEDELNYINDYHECVFLTLKERFDNEGELEFLAKLTSKI